MELNFSEEERLLCWINSNSLSFTQRPELTHPFPTTHPLAVLGVHYHLTETTKCTGKTQPYWYTVLQKLCTKVYSYMYTIIVSTIQLYLTPDHSCSFTSLWPAVKSLITN